MKTEIKTGSVVRLKSGGPWMAVRRLDVSSSVVASGEDVAICQWFEGPRLQERAFAITVLEARPNE